MPRTIEISHRTILFTLGVLAGSWLIYQIRDILYLLFVAFILMTALRPLVDAIVSYKIPRVLAIALVYVLIFGGIGSVFSTLIPTISTQSSRLLQDLPSTVSQVMPSLDLNLSAVTQDLAPLTQNILKVGLEIFNNIVTVLTILVFTFYFLLGRTQIRHTVSKFAGEDATIKVFEVVNDVEEKLGYWARGQIVLMAIIGVAVYVGLSLLGVEYALPLALLAGILEVVPMIGPFISAVPAVLFAFTISPLLALSVAALYFLVQQFENHLIVPYVMKKSIGFSPVLTITAFMIGARFEGALGAILAIPTILVLQVIAGHVLSSRK